MRAETSPILYVYRNPGYPTIEEELLKAFKEAGAICDEWFETPQKGHFQRASRTDKGVSAARMIISLKLRKSGFLSLQFRLKV